MSWNALSFNDLLTRARQAFRSYLPGSDAWLWPNNIYVAAKVKAALTKFAIDYADYIARQAFVHKADEVGVSAHGAEWGIPRNPASAASGNVLVTAGSGVVTIAPGAILTRSDGVAFSANIGASLAPTTSASLSVIAATVGKITQTEAGTALNAFSGVSGDATFVVDDSGLDGGRDMESLDSWRERIWWRKKYTPAGGAPADWVAWAREVPGVTRVYLERAWLGAGTLRLICYLDDDRTNGLATDADRAIIQQHLETKFSCGSFVVAAPSVVPVNVTISGLHPDTSAVRAEILAELADAFRRHGRPAGNDTGHPDFDFLMTPTSFSLSWIDEAISNAEGEQRHVLASPSGDVSLSSGQAPVLGTVTFI